MATNRKLVPGLIEGSFMFTTLMLAYTFPYYDVILTRLLTCAMGPNSLFRCIRTHCNCSKVSGNTINCTCLGSQLVC